jgi:hypothetical protein
MTHSVVVLGGVEPISWAIGGLTLLILLSLMAALVIFGGGREHS